MVNSILQTTNATARSALEAADAQHRVGQGHGAILFAVVLSGLLAACRHSDVGDESVQSASDVRGEVSTTTIQPELHSRKIASESFSKPRMLQGRVLPLETATERVFALSEGWVQEVRVNQGDRVAAGQRLLRFRSIELTEWLNSSGIRKHSRHGEYFEPAPRRQGSRHRESRQRERVTQWTAAAAKSFQAPPIGKLPASMVASGQSEYWVVATRSGTVVELGASPGRRIRSGDPVPLVAIADLDTVMVAGELHVGMLGSLRAGQSVSIWSLDSDSRLDGTLFSIADCVNRERQSVEVRVLAKNADRGLFPNQIVELTLTPDSGAIESVRIPSNALHWGSQGPSVFVESENGALKRRTVTLGQSQGEWVEILDGLGTGEQVVIQET